MNLHCRCSILQWQEEVQEIVFHVVEVGVTTLGEEVFDQFDRSILTFTTNNTINTLLSLRDKITRAIMIEVRNRDREVEENLILGQDHDRDHAAVDVVVEDTIEIAVEVDLDREDVVRQGRSPDLDLHPGYDHVVLFEIRRNHLYEIAIAIMFNRVLTLDREAVRELVSEDESVVDDLLPKLKSRVRDHVLYLLSKGHVVVPGHFLNLQIAEVVRGLNLWIHRKSNKKT